MPGTIFEKGNENPKKAVNLDGLEDILKKTVSIETDVMDFLMIIGWNRYYLRYSSIYQNAEISLKGKIIEHIKARRAALPMGVKGMESRFCNTCFYNFGFGGDYGGYRKHGVKTLRDVKNSIEEKGVRYKKIGYSTITYFNETLCKYNIDPFDIKRYNPKRIKDNHSQ